MYVLMEATHDDSEICLLASICSWYMTQVVYTHRSLASAKYIIKRVLSLSLLNQAPVFVVE